MAKNYDLSQLSMMGNDVSCSDSAIGTWRIGAANAVEDRTHCQQDSDAKSQGTQYCTILSQQFSTLRGGPQLSPFSFIVKSLTEPTWYDNYYHIISENDDKCGPPLRYMYIMGHLFSCNAPLCCDRIVQYSTLQSVA